MKFFHERVEARYRTGRHRFGDGPAYSTIDEAYSSSDNRNPDSLGIFDSYEEAKALFDLKVKECFHANLFTYANMRFIDGDVYFIEEWEYEYDEDYEEWERIDYPETLDYYASSLPEEDEEEEEEEED